MILRKLHVQNFRNLPLVQLEFGDARTFFAGSNGQGKTNALEAAGLLGALRSFRGAEPRDLIRHGAAEARVWCVLEHERDGTAEVEIVIRPRQRTVSVNGARCTKLGEFLGRFPVVALSSHDLQLLRGAPQGRRRALDLTIASLDFQYLAALRRYHTALDHRNALLRGPKAPTVESLAAFEAQLAPEATAISAKRKTVCAEMVGHLTTAYNRLTGDAPEKPALAYLPDAEVDGVEGWRILWEQSRTRDLTMRTTTRGPHRDDFAFRLIGKDAKNFGSEGQQRGLVVSWRLAEAAWQHARTGIAPLVLADDVLGELDPARRTGFWRAAGDAGQVLATGTTLPTGEEVTWEVWGVKDGGFTKTI